VILLHHPGLPPGAGLYDRLLTVRTAVLRPGTLAEPASWLPLLPKEEKPLRGAVLCRAGKDADAAQELAGLLHHPGLQRRSGKTSGVTVGSCGRPAGVVPDPVLVPAQIAVEVGGGRWLDKAAVFVATAIVAPVFPLVGVLGWSAGFAAWGQASLPDRVSQHIATYLSRIA
jgi:hypothetical protein